MLKASTDVQTQTLTSDIQRTAVISIQGLSVLSAIITASLSGSVLILLNASTLEDLVEMQS